MFDFFTKKNRTPSPETAPAPVTPSLSWGARLKAGLQKTRLAFTDRFSFLKKATRLDPTTLKELEKELICADLGVTTTQSVLAQLQQNLKQNPDSHPLALLKTTLQALISPYQTTTLTPQSTPYVLLFVGVNGAGKTTTIGKLGAQLKAQGHSVLLAAGDTFRAAAVAQLQAWGERIGVPCIAHTTGADSAAVLFDAYTSAKAKNIDFVLADTAGRLHNKTHLMEELKKIVRILQKQDPTAPQEIMLILDANTGQNGLQQAKVFADTVPLSSLSITKLDGTAKGGILFAIAQQLKLPIRYIGVGEQVEDLQPFNPEYFVNALFEEEPPV